MHVWAFVALFAVSTVHAGDSTAEDCAPVGNCGKCTFLKDSLKNKVCVWCRTNATCQSAALTCPNEVENGSDEVVYDTSKCVRVSQEQMFVVAVVAIVGALVLMAIVGFIVHTQQAKKEDKQNELDEFKKKEKGRSKKNNIEQRVALIRGHGELEMGELRDKKRIKQKWQVLSKGGLRVRGGPTKESEKRGILPSGSIVVSTKKRGNWIKHSQGWSMIDDGKKNGRKFLKLTDDGGLSGEIQAAKRKKGWSCPACGKHNSKKRPACRGCGCEKGMKKVKNEEIIVLSLGDGVEKKKKRKKKRSRKKSYSSD